MSASGCRANVLLVEADAAAARDMQAALEQVADGGLRVAHSTGVGEARGVLEGGGFELVLIGGNLPDGDPAQACRALGRSAPDALVLPAGRADAHWLQGALEHVSRCREAHSARRVAEQALSGENERLRVTLRCIGDAVLETDRQGSVICLNPVAEAMTGWTRSEAAGRPLPCVFQVVDGGTGEPCADPARRAMAEGRTVGLEGHCVLLRRDGSRVAIEQSAAPLHDGQGCLSGAVLAFRDVRQHRGAACRMARLARHDGLTGLANRLQLHEQLEQAIGLARRQRARGALLFVNLNDFRAINETAGRAVGDHLLQLVGRTLADRVRATDTVCRQDADEFVILLAQIRRPDDAARVAEALLTAFASPLLVDGHRIAVTPRIGISVFPDDGEEAEPLLEHADVALYHARVNGEPGYGFARGDANSRALHRRSVRQDLRRALVHDELRLHYQPQFDLVSGELVGFEAFLRWQDPEHGLLEPAQFATIADQGGLMAPIGRWVLAEACRQIAAWRAAGESVPVVSVNISAAELRQPDFVNSVAEALADSGVPPATLGLEVSEAAVTGDTSLAVARLRGLEILGVQLAIGGFAAGRTSLRDLRRFPVDTLKLDRHVVAGMTFDGECAAVARAVIGLARNLRRRVVAEGVESAAQLACLRAERCHAAQGFHLGRPAPAAQARREFPRAAGARLGRGGDGAGEGRDRRPE